MVAETEFLVNQDDDISITSHTSLVELMHIYDRLLMTTNRNADVVVPLSSADCPIQLQKVYQKLRLVCSLLLIVPNKFSLDQSHTLKSTAQKAHVLQLLCLSENGDAGIDGISCESSLIPVQIVTTAVSNTTLNSSDKFEWEYGSIDDVDDNNHVDGSPVIPLSISPQELLEEESMLLQMANTPIPTEMDLPLSLLNEIDCTKTTAGHSSSNIDTIQQRICELWGNVQYAQKVEQIRSLSFTNSQE
jgi:hypothetical protein